MGSNQDVAAAFPPTIETLILLGHGLTDMTVESIHIKFTEVGVYASPEIKEYIGAFKGQPASELTKEGSQFYKQILEAPVKKLIKIIIVKGIKGRNYGEALETNIRDKLAYDDKYEEEEEAELESLQEFFLNKKLDPGATVTYSWSPTCSSLEVSVDSSQSHTVNNENVVKAILDLFLGEKSLSPSTIASIADTVESGRLL